MATRLILCLSALMPLPALAESPIAELVCAPKAEMEQRLAIRFGSSRTATGLRDPETLLEVWTSPQGRWTLVQSHANGQSCIVAMGEGWDMPRADGRG